MAELVQRLLDWVDENRIPMVVGEKLSFLRKNEQEWVADAIQNGGAIPSKQQAEQLKDSSGSGGLTEDGVYAVLMKKGISGTGGVTISAKRIREFFPPAYTKEQIEGVIYALLEEWRQKEGGEE